MLTMSAMIYCLWIVLIFYLELSREDSQDEETGDKRSLLTKQSTPRGDEAADIEEQKAEAGQSSGIRLASDWKFWKWSEAK